MFIVHVDINIRMDRGLFNLWLLIKDERFIMSLGSSPFFHCYERLGPSYLIITEPSNEKETPERRQECIL